MDEIVAAAGPAATDAQLGLGASLYRASGKTEGTEAERTADRASLLRKAGESFKGAARGDSEDQAAMRDLAVVLDELPEADEQAKIAKLMEEHAQSSAFDLARRMLENERQIVEDISAAHTNSSPSRISQLESAARRQEENADLWIPLKGKFLQAMPQQGDDAAARQAELGQFIEATRDNMIDTARRLEDMDQAGYESARLTEASVYHLWKGVAPYAPLLQEDMRRQTNAMTINGAAAADDRAMQPLAAEQDEAAELTRLFTKRFSEAVPEETAPVPQQGQQEEPEQLSPETRKEILDLAAEALGSQEKASALIGEANLVDALVEQKAANNLLKQIEELLPKEETPSKQPEQQQQDEQDQSEQQADEEEQQPGEPDAQPEEQPREQPEPQEQDGDPAEEEKHEISEEQMRNMLEKALEREREHEEEKRRRRRIPLSPRERDW